MRIIKTNQAGFDHIILAAVCVVIFGIVGTTLFYIHRTAPKYVELRLASDNTCFDGQSVNACNTDNKQMLFTQPSGNNFQIKDENGYCVDDWNGQYQSEPTSKGGTQYLPLLSPCKSNDPDQEWNWTGPGNHELASVGSGGKGCLNSAAVSASSAGQVTIYQCNGQINENLFQVSVSQPSSESDSSTAGQENASASGSSNSTSPSKVSSSTNIASSNQNKSTPSSSATAKSNVSNSSGAGTNVKSATATKPKTTTIPESGSEIAGGHGMCLQDANPAASASTIGHVGNLLIEPCGSNNDLWKTIPEKVYNGLTAYAFDMNGEWSDCIALTNYTVGSTVNVQSCGGTDHSEVSNGGFFLEQSGELIYADDKNDCISTVNNSLSSGTKLILEPCQGLSGQLWTFK